MNSTLENHVRIWVKIIKKPGIMIFFHKDGMISVMDRTIELGLKKKTIILGLELCVRFGHRREKSSYKINIKTFFTQRKCHYCCSKTMSSVWDETRYFLGVSSSLYSIEGIPINLSVLLQNSRFLLDEKFFQLQKLKFFYVIFPYINALVYYVNIPKQGIH